MAGDETDRRIAALAREFESTVNRLTDNEEIITGLKAFLRLLRATDTLGAPGTSSAPSAHGTPAAPDTSGAPTVPGPAGGPTPRDVAPRGSHTAPGAAV
ncbi:hypothetical protein EAO70_10280 [Streptomyces sp. adm13(2018)]|uniref:hypothetical protein n=1 Tax=Streptomyces sp. adm13(2018) TaxID=2479007 RepID=UPI0011CD5A11|nr:hypothetical protein EAO70_10280 [Streptomyces sp. adm13(2018)]